MIIRKDVRDLISVNERIQSALLTNDPLTEEEAAIIRFCAAELLSNVSEPEQTYSPA